MQALRSNMKINHIYLSLLLLITSFGVKAEESQYTQEYLNNACTYLGGFCEIAKKKCLSEKSPNLDKCLVDYTIQVMNRRRIPQDPADLRNEKYSKKACEKLADECNFIQLECLAGGGLFNTCIAMSYFAIEVSKELCGVMGYKACLDRDREFGVKVIHELTIPNIGKPIKQTMWKECTHAGNYKVKSIELKEFYYGYMDNLKYLKEPILLSKEDDYEHKIQEDYYDCMKAVLEKAS
jgi:hypothetical protein